MLVEVYCSGPVFTNSYLLGCTQTKEGAIIDAPSGSASHLIERIENDGLHVEKLLLTHSHWDHFADAAELKEKLGLKVYIHPEDAKNLESPGADGLPLLIEVPPVKPDFFYEEGQVIPVGNLKLEVIHTPGHSPGGVCFYIREENLLIAGDTLFRGSIGNLSFPESEPEKMWKSLEKLAALPSDTRVLSGHGEETTIGQESWLKDAKKYFGG